MRRLYKRLLIFLLPVILAWAGLEFFYRNVETNYTFKHKRIQQEYNKAEILILGSSHSYFGLNPEYFSRPTYNFSNISQSLYFDELLLKRHIDSMKQLKTVVLTVGYFSLSQKDDGVEDRWRKYFYEQQMDLDVPIVSKLDIRRYSLALTRRFDKSMGLFGLYVHEGSTLSCFENGYGKQDSTDIVPDKAAVSVQIAKKHEDGSLDFTHNLERLTRMIEHCKERGVEVLIVEMPVYPTYFDSVNSVKRDSITRSLRTLTSNYINARHLDLKINESFTENDLRDADHLTNKGAQKCSEFVSAYIDMGH